MDQELLDILKAFAASGWDELALPVRQFLKEKRPPRRCAKPSCARRLSAEHAAAPSTPSIPGRSCCWRASGICVTKREHSLNLLSK